MQHLVVVLSSSSVDSFWVKRELNFALVDKVGGLVLLYGVAVNNQASEDIAAH